MAKKKRNNFYTLAIWFALVASIAFILPFILILHSLGLGVPLPEWVIALIYGPFFVSQEIAGAGYVGKWIDFLTGEKKFSHVAREIASSWKKSLHNFSTRINAENIGLTIGIVIGITVTILQAALHCAIPFASVVGHVIAGAVYCFANINDFGGLGNRLGRTIDYFFGRHTGSKEDIFRKQNVNYALAIVAGVLIGAAIATAALVVTAASMGVVPSILFTIAAVGACASSSGYIGRCADFFLGERTVVHVVKDNIDPPKAKPATTFKERCSKENIGTVVGVAAGIIAASVLIGLGIMTLPFFGVGLPKIFAGVFLMTAMVGAGGGLGNRLGHAIDRYTGRQSLGIDDEIEKDSKNSSPENSRQNGHSPDNTPRPSLSVPKLYTTLRPTDAISLSINSDDSHVPLLPNAAAEKHDAAIKLPYLEMPKKKAQPSITTYEKHAMFKLPKRSIPFCEPIKIADKLRTSVCAAAA